jgi:hypothetical protein
MYFTFNALGPERSSSEQPVKSQARAALISRPKGALLGLVSVGILSKRSDAPGPIHRALGPPTQAHGPLHEKGMRGKDQNHRDLHGIRPLFDLEERGGASRAGTSDAPSGAASLEPNATTPPTLERHR